MRSRLLLAAAVGLVLVGNHPARPAWTAGAAGSSLARAAVLAPPTQLSAARQPAGVDLSWTRSGSGWTTGYRVLRSPTAGGDLVEVAALGPAATGWTDATAGAGSWHYVVRATAASWSATTTTSSAERVYRVRATAGFTDAECPAAGTTADLAQGHVPPGGTGTAVALGTITLCTDRFSAGQVLPAGSTTVQASVANSSSKSCTVDLALLWGATLLGSGAGTVPAGSTLHASPWAFATAGAVFADGDRLTVRLRARGSNGTNNCSQTTLHGDGSLAPSHVVLAG